MSSEGEPVKGSRVTAEERLTILKMHDDGFQYRKICRVVGRSPHVVLKTIRDFAPTTKLATRYLQAQSMRLAERIVEKADVDQALDILSRPNIGVLEPVSNKGPSIGVFMSINPDSLGGMAAPEPKVIEGEFNAVPIGETAPVHALPAPANSGPVGEGGARKKRDVEPSALVASQPGGFSPPT